MRIPVWLTLVAAVAALAVVIVIGLLIITPPRDLIVEAGFAPERITPNADGVDDVTIFSYVLSRNARVSIVFEAEDGTAFAFRSDEARIPGDYQVAFSGVVDGFTLPGEAITGEVLRRLIPDGRYTWRMDAVGEDGASERRTGALEVADGDAPLPELPEFTVHPQLFTPNQDGIADRTQINVFVTKEAELTVYLLGEDQVPIYIGPRQESTRIGEAGRHLYDYEGGVDLGANPPADGRYQVLAEAQDAVGQRIRRTSELTISTGGKPVAQILAQPTGPTVVFEHRAWEDRFFSERDNPGDLVTPPESPESLNLTAITMPVGDLLVFKLTIENIGSVPIRTTGPEPGTVYEWDQTESGLGWFEEAGAWRVGIDCTTAPRNYPWRWAIGNADNLVAEVNPLDGQTYYYLPAGARSVIWGGIRMTDIEVFNPQNCWAGLIHEQVAVSEFNNVVGAREIELVEAEPSAIH